MDLDFQKYAFTNVKINFFQFEYIFFHLFFLHEAHFYACLIQNSE